MRTSEIRGQIERLHKNLWEGGIANALAIVISLYRDYELRLANIGDGSLLVERQWYPTSQSGEKCTYIQDVGLI